MIPEFRGLYKSDGFWVYGSYIHCEVYGDIIKPFDSLIEYDVIPETVGQYIGLTDKKGKKIYQGDICKHVILRREATVNPLVTLTVIVQQRYGCWGYLPTHPTLVHPDDREWKPFYQDEELDLDYFEVIGNIHEHPELIK